ncbi:MAG: ATP-dependent DNA helicase RecG [Candidatus Uhrbacteria bacterium GW2011_GWC2_53_7]|uniref:Probable DNA 3'-5' helicase RecG n=1 Tax=Candidatus Uhrbacteria bacterium GW2011_GWC2_53_7 TaxID=1618986 RepID=A0A0G1XYI9_9BACT|nr:MAG: ATP-dependent DNA helicase RecG [Candidatus Uhrbacteria bacterium GW2011_GWC2_53_7]
MLKLRRGMATLYDKVSVLHGLGAVGAKALAKVGVKTVRDLLFYFPFRYEDYSKVKTISELIPGETVSLTAEIVSIEARPSRKSRVMVTEALVKDETGELTVKWFNQPFLTKSLKPGTRVSLAGATDLRAGLVLVNPRYEKISPDGETVHTGRIVPVYPRSGTVGEKRLRSAIKESLSAASKLADALPAAIREAEGFPSLAEAICSIHFPGRMAELDRAVARLKFDELFLHQLLFAEVKKDRKEQSAYQIPIAVSELKTFVASLPFALTNAQRLSAWEVIQDLAKEHPMNRLLEGDVGSGKTVVSAMAINAVLGSAHQAAYLAPTEILAKQQYQALCELLPRGSVALLTRAECEVGGEAIDRLGLQHRLKMDALVVVATHAILEEDWRFDRLALIVIDEQHRWGVRQRHELLARHLIAPHLLSMSATPMPRSLSLTIYGDLDLSVIGEMPKGRKPIETKVVFDKVETEMYRFVRGQLDEGYRVYIVCPLIDPSDRLGVASVSETAERLRRGHLKDYKVAELHGRMKTEEKEEAMRKFKDGSIPVLISTTVVEVGVDVPEATVMVIEGAERFGLAQLHQLRGRVGRSDKKSYCFLRPSGFLQGKSLERLQAMVRCQNGFQLAELDLEFRGPGNVFGNAQSGFPDFQLATLADVPLMKKARDLASRLLEEDPTLEGHPLLRDGLLAKSDELHLE